MQSTAAEIFESQMKEYVFDGIFQIENLPTFGMY